MRTDNIRKEYGKVGMLRLILLSSISDSLAAMRRKKKRRQKYIFEPKKSNLWWPYPTLSLIDHALGKSAHLVINPNIV